MTTTERLKERPSPLALTPSAGEPHLPGIAEWLARQKKRSEADLLRRELETFRPDPVSFLLREGDKLVPAGQLPPVFEIATTWHEPALARAEREGSRVRVSIMGESVLLQPWQRVRVLVLGKGGAS